MFVAVSINLARILEHPALPGRALEALVVLVVLLLVATFGLVPGQSTGALGAEILATALSGWGLTVFIQVSAPRKPSDLRSWTVTRAAATQLATLPMVIAGVSLIVERGGGLYWTVAGVIASLLAALLDAWVLLVEIQR